jgi:hypothetical protein
VGIHSTTGPIYSVPLLGGDAGTEQTIWKLRGLIDDAWKDSYVNRTAIDIVRNAGVQPYDTWGQIRAIYNWILGSFYFVNDPVTKEAIRPTTELLELMAGDCDDINANLLPALLGTIGYETRFVTIAADPQHPDNFSHIYVEVFQDGAWYPLDAAHPGARFGTAPQSFFKREWWSTVDGSHGDYPADALAGSMAGYHSHGVRGLGAVLSDIELAFQGAGTALRAVNGQIVQPAVGPAQGPGGAQMVSPAPSAGVITSGEEEILFLALAAGLIWWGLS